MYKRQRIAPDMDNRGPLNAEIEMRGLRQNIADRGRLV